MPGRPHHSKEWHDCVEQVMAKSGKDKSSAAAICTASLEKAGKPIYATADRPESGAGKMGKPFQLRKDPTHDTAAQAHDAAAEACEGVADTEPDDPERPAMAQAAGQKSKKAMMMSDELSMGMPDLPASIAEKPKAAAAAHRKAAAAHRQKMASAS